MAKKANKTKSKRRSTAKFKAKRSGSKPLMAKAASVRTAKPTTRVSRASNGKPPISPRNPALSGSKPLMAPDQRGAAKINDRIEFIILERK